MVSQDVFFLLLEYKKEGLVAPLYSFVSNGHTIKLFLSLQVVSLQTESDYYFSFKSKKSAITATRNKPALTNKPKKAKINEVASNVDIFSQSPLLT